MSDRMSDAVCAPAVVGSLVDLTGMAFASAEGVQKVEADDIEQLIDALHVLRPGCAELEFFDGWLHILRKDWMEAEAIYRSLIARSLCMPASKGMLLQCLKGCETFGWQSDARQLLEEHPGDEVGHFAKTLLAGDDLREAMITAKRTGNFVVPESTREMNAEAEAKAKGEFVDDKAAYIPTSSMSDMLMTMQYIRI